MRQTMDNSAFAAALPGAMADAAPWDEEDLTALDWDIMPRGLRELRNLVGPGAAVLLAEEYGGGPVYIPCRLREDHPLAELMGEQRFARLAAVYGGDKLHVPKADAIVRQMRMRRIRRLRGEGWTVASLAREFNLTRRRVRQICAEWEGRS